MAILIIIGILILFVAGGMFGWMIKGIEIILSFLGEGWSSIFGCLFWAFVIFVLLVGLL